MNQNGPVSQGSPQAVAKCSLWIRVFSRIPLALWYPFSRFVAFVAWRVIPYRRHVVEGNLTKSFPEWDAATRERVIRDYYRGFADVFVEVMHSLRLSPAELARRVTLKNSNLNGAVFTPWLVTRSSKASWLVASHQDWLIAWQAPHAALTISCRSGGRESQAALLTISSVTVEDSCQPVV